MSAPGNFSAKGTAYAHMMRGHATIVIPDERDPVKEDDTASLHRARATGFAPGGFRHSRTCARLTRAKGQRDGNVLGELPVFSDGRDSEAAEVLVLPRRERCILE